MSQHTGDSVAPPAAAGGLSYQPALDGLRAISVIAVILYHAGFSWMHGGFVGVEVFFVVSGFLITALMLEERTSTGRIALGAFWRRRARRLLPALLTMLVATATWAVLFGSAEQRSQMRRDLPWSLGYAANWGQIVGDVPYFAPSPPLLRHLWSLAVEEQWYLIWPLVVVAVLVRRLDGARRLRRAVVLGMVGVALAATVSWVATSNELTPRLTNLLYLSTPTRASGLLLGAALAFAWRPWRREGHEGIPPGHRRPSWLTIDVLGSAAVAAIGFAAVSATVTEVDLYQWILPVVSVASVAAVFVVTHPDSTVFRPLFAWAPFVAVGRRSYGLYLWSWPISRIVGAYHGSAVRCAVAMAITVPVNEACYRLIETPIRRGAIGAWWASHPPGKRRWGALVAVVSAVAVTVAGVVAFSRQPAVFDAAVDQGGEDVVFGTTPVSASTDPALTPPPAPTLPVVTLPVPTLPAPTLPAPTPAVTVSVTVPAGGTSVDRTTPNSVPVPVPVPAPPTSSSFPGSKTGSSITATPAPTAAPLTAPPESTIPPGPISVLLLGDSQAHSLAVNLPKGLDAAATVYDGSLDGCSVYETGIGVSSQGTKRRFPTCAGWLDRWATSARLAQADVAVVMIGAWDVLDVDLDGSRLVFGTPAHDQRVLAGLQSGIDVVAATGTKVALLEVACMRPIDAPGAAVAPLPERADDQRVAHLNALLRQAAARNPKTTRFLPGPAAWCTDPAIATDTAYRWDGVHVYRRGAKLILDTIIPELQATTVRR